MKKKYKLGIALGGGGTRGFAHLGVLQALQEHNINPEIIAGTSAGAIAGALVASGMNPRQAFEVMKVKKFTEFSKIHIPDLGLFSLEKLKERIQEEIPKKNIQDLQTPLFVTLSNLNKGCVEYVNEGPLDVLVMASSSIPIVFIPVEYNGFQYVDGGLFDNLPTEPLMSICEKVIAVNVNPVSELHNIDNMKDMATRTFLLNVNATLSETDRKADMFIEPPGLDKYDILDASYADEMYKIGYEYAKKMNFDVLR